MILERKEVEKVSKGGIIHSLNCDDIYVASYNDDYVNVEAQGNEIAFIPQKEFDEEIVDNEKLSISNGNYSYSYNEIVDMIKEEVANMSSANVRFEEIFKERFKHDFDYENYAISFLKGLGKGPRLQISLRRAIQEKLCSMVLGD